MKKGQILEGTVREVAFPNRALVEIDGETKPVEVKNGLAGQKVRLQVNKIRKGKAEGRILEVLEKAPDEIEPQCPHFCDCGGCTYQNLPYESQLAMKETQVRKLLDEVIRERQALEIPEDAGKEAQAWKVSEEAVRETQVLEVSDKCAAGYIFEGIKGSPLPFAYRNKMEFSFGDACKDGPLALGMHKRGGFYDIVTVDGCRIVDEDFRKILTCVLDYFTEQKTTFYHKLRHEGYLRHLLVRKAKKTGEILVDLVTSSQVDSRACAMESMESISEPLAAPESTGGFLRTDAERADGRGNSEDRLLHGMTERMLALDLDGEIAGILHTVNDSLADVIQNDGTTILHGQDYFYEELLGLRFRITPFSFFQTNSMGAEVLYDTARSYVGDTKDKIIFDLYSGTGTIAQILAPVARKVIGIEIVEEAVEAARANAAENGLKNCEFLAGDVLKMIDTVEEKPDIIVLDPPRDGIHPKALSKIIAYGVETIVYISCKPTSLARDLVTLQAAGYRVERVCCVDLFPGTVHVETVCLLSNRKPDARVKIDVDLEDYYRIKDEQMKNKASE